MAINAEVTLDDIDVPRAGFGGAGRSGSRNLLSRYLQMLRHYPPIDAESELKLIQRYYVEGDRRAGRELISANLRLVVRMAMKYGRNRMELLDLVQEGNIGLLEALDRFDTTREVRFATYARHWIRAMMLKYLLDNHRLVRIGSTRAGRKLFFRLRKERRRMEREGLEVTAETLAERLGVAVEEVRTVDAHLANAEASIFAPAGPEDDARTLSDVIADEGQASPEDRAVRSERREVIRDRLDAFAESIHDERDRVIWERRTTATRPATLADLGEEFGVSKERVRQLEARMKRRLKDWMSKELGDEMPDLLEAPEDVNYNVKYPG